MGWSVDLIVGLPPASDGATICIVGIDVYSKLAVMHPLPDRQSVTTARWLYAHIVTEYGRPRFVRTDHGAEFKGAFDSMLRDLGIAHTKGVPYYPQANGQVEIYNRVIKRALRK